jgi:hypothetical protein
MQGKTAYFGHQTTGELMGWSEWDDMGVELERRLSFAQQLDEPATIDVIRVWANTGHTPLLTGQGTDPTIELRLSDDAGNTWGDWEADRLGCRVNIAAFPNGGHWAWQTFPGSSGRFA